MNIVSLYDGMFFGAFLWIGLILCTSSKSLFFKEQGLTLFLIHNACDVVVTVTMCAILAVWH
jgi:hypothetical protein